MTSLDSKQNKMNASISNQDSNNFERARQLSGDEEEMSNLEPVVQKCKLSTNKKNSANKKFQRFFGSKLLGNSHEQVISIFSCALLRNHSRFLLHGSLYVTKQFYGFHSNIFGFRTVFLGKWSEVTSLKKENVALFFPTAISFTTKKNEKFTFASFLSRNYAFKYFCKLWHLQSPFYEIDLSENVEINSFDSKEVISKPQNTENSEGFQFNNEYYTSSAERSDSTGSQSESCTSKSKSSISSRIKKDEVSKKTEESLHVNSFNANNQDSIPNNNPLTPREKVSSSQGFTSNSPLVSANTKQENPMSTSFFNKMLVFFFSKNFLVHFLAFLILLIILITLYIYVFIIFFHVNQIERKLSDLHNRLTE